MRNVSKILLLQILPAIIFQCVCLSQQIGPATPPGKSSWIDSLESVTSFIDQNVARLAPRAYIEQRKKRNDVQRRTYAGILFDECNGDGLTALCGYIKMQLNFSYSWRTLFRTFDVAGYRLPDECGFPVDPWKKEWWSYR